MSDDVTFTIDGQEITAPKGTLIIRAAEQLGIIVPRFCDHPLLDPVGACRQCIVEVEGLPKPMMACTTTVMPDKAVKTHLTSDIARKGQEGTLEFLLINHPLDCPMCDKGGECPLQDQALAHGSNASRFIDQKRRYDKPVAVSSQILLDRERCVLCARCTRFSDQISGDPFIELFERGALEQVAIYEDEPYESYFSGNVIQICPVGALTSTSYRFKSRPFDVVTTPSVCDHCSAGCTLTVQSRRGEIQRQLARTNMAVNEAWNCDKGRFGFGHVTAANRITEPKVRDGDDLVTATWTEVLRRMRAAIGAATEAGPGRVAVLTGSRLADEDAYATSKYARTVLATDDIDHRTRFAPAGEREELAAVVGRDSATYADVERAEVIVVVGLDPEEEVPILHLRLRKAWRNRKARIVVVGPHLGTLADLAWRHVATEPGAEAAGLEALDGRDADGVAAEVAEALREATAPVVLVGERAGAGALTTAASLAETTAGSFAYVPRRAGTRGAIDAGLAAGLLPGGRRLDDADDRAALEEHWGELPAEPGRDLHAILTDAAAGKIDVLHLIGVDPVRDAPSTDLARAALAKVTTVIVQDLARTDTVQGFADIVLPVAARQERAGTATNWEGRRQRFSRAIDGPDLVQEDWEILVQVAAILGKDLGFSDLEALRAEVERVGRRDAAHPFPSFPSVPSDETDGDADDQDDDRLTVVARPLLLDHGTMLTNVPDLMATARPATVVINPTDADRHDIGAGDQVELAGANGTLTLPAQLATDVVPGTVLIPTNSTDEPSGVLADRDGDLRVTLSKVAADAPVEEVA